MIPGAVQVNREFTLNLPLHRSSLHPRPCALCPTAQASYGSTGGLPSGRQRPGASMLARANSGLVPSLSSRGGEAAYSGARSPAPDVDRTLARELSGLGLGGLKTLAREDSFNRVQSGGGSGSGLTGLERQRLHQLQQMSYSSGGRLNGNGADEGGSGAGRSGVVGGGGGGSRTFAATGAVSRKLVSQGTSGGGR